VTYDYNEHIAQLQEQRDSVARELREYRNDQESRYRENQIRELWTRQRGVNTESTVTDADRAFYEELGEEEEDREKYVQLTSKKVCVHRSAHMLPSSISSNFNSSEIILPLIALIGFAILCFLIGFHG